jgi:predicted nucleotidyltransferase
VTHPKLDEFVQKLKATAPDNLKSVILYGSAATEEFHTKHSDLNLLCIVDRADTRQIEALHEPVKWWVKRGHRSPLVFTLEELLRSADVFTIELLDMKAHHRVLLGEDLLAGLAVPMHNHAIQVERELRTDWLRLRQAILAAPKRESAYLDLMVASFSTFVALFRHALIAMAEPPAANKREAIDRVAQFAHSDPAGFHAILDLREGKRKDKDIDVENTLNRYFALVEAVTDEFDRQLEARK